MVMYNDIVSIYDEIFPLNQSFLQFLQDYLEDQTLRILDLGCGPGGYVDLLSRLGHDVVGIDSSTEMIKKAQSEAMGTFYPLSFTEIRQLGREYDLIFCIGNSLSYLPNISLRTFFEDVYFLMRVDGNFILQVVNWDKFKVVGTSDFEVKTLSSDRSFHRRYESGDGEAVIFHTKLLKGDEVLGTWTDPLYPKRVNDLRSKARVAGWRNIVFYGDFEKSAHKVASSPATIMTMKKGKVPK
jgi:glycine/sarcosine N-methyltransferase